MASRGKGSSSDRSDKKLHTIHETVRAGEWSSSECVRLQCAVIRRSFIDVLRQINDINATKNTSTLAISMRYKFETGDSAPRAITLASHSAGPVAEVLERTGIVHFMLSALHTVSGNASVIIWRLLL